MTERKPSVWLRSLLVTMAMLVAATAALAACPGGSTDDGVGGSGRKPVSKQVGETLAYDSGDEDGIGGSGRKGGGDEDGIGGSGLVGTITGFGSVCINGRRITYDPDVAVTYDGDAANSEDLEIGQVVRIVASAEKAQVIDILFAVVGTATELDDGSYEVLGQRIKAAAQARNAENALVAGRRVAVSGLRHPDGSIMASRIDPATETQTDRVHDWKIGDLFGPEIDDIDVEGYVHSADADELSLGSVRFRAGDLAETSARPKPERGERVYVRGPRHDFDRFRAEHIDRVPDIAPMQERRDARDRGNARPDQGPPLERDHRPDGMQRPPDRPPIPDLPPRLDRPPVIPREHEGFDRPPRRPRGPGPG